MPLLIHLNGLPGAAPDVMHRDLEAFLRDRDHVATVVTEGLTSEQTYQLVMRSLLGG